MRMKIGIIGLGIVGEAVKQGLELIGHNVKGYDIKYPETLLTDVLDTCLCFICLPTPSVADGSCDGSIVEGVIEKLDKLKYRGIVVIKSTVIPGTTDKLSKKFKLKLAFCPEFLRERSAFADFTDNNDLCIIGAYNESDYKLIKEAHGQLPKKFSLLTPIEAEFSKYFSNIYNALRIVFANEFYEVCQKVGVDYTNIKNAMVKRDRIVDDYLDCNENYRGFGGVCLPKDTLAFANLVRKLELDLTLFETIVEENKKFKRTTPEGMRP